MQNQNIETLVKNIEDYSAIGEFLIQQIQIEKQNIQRLKQLQAAIKKCESANLIEVLF